MKKAVMFDHTTLWFKNCSNIKTNNSLILSEKNIFKGYKILIFLDMKKYWNWQVTNDISKGQDTLSDNFLD